MRECSAAEAAGGWVASRDRGSQGAHVSERRCRPGLTPAAPRHVAQTNAGQTGWGWAKVSSPGSCRAAEEPGATPSALPWLPPSEWSREAAWGCEMGLKKRSVGAFGKGRASVVYTWCLDFSVCNPFLDPSINPLGASVFLPQLSLETRKTNFIILQGKPG